LCPEPKDMKNEAIYHTILAHETVIMYSLSQRKWVKFTMQPNANETTNCTEIPGPCTVVAIRAGPILGYVVCSIGGGGGEGLLSRRSEKLKIPVYNLL